LTRDKYKHLVDDGDIDKALRDADLNQHILARDAIDSIRRAVDHFKQTEKAFGRLVDFTADASAISIASCPDAVATVGVYMDFVHETST
jgi:hypothetical protein